MVESKEGKRLFCSACRKDMFMNQCNNGHRCTGCGSVRSLGSVPTGSTTIRRQKMTAKERKRKSAH